MPNIRQVIDDLTTDAMRDLLTDRMGRTLPADASEQYLRNTLLADHKAGLLFDRDIREMAEGA